jgi:tRNA (guanine37-N1)-methyltransferase
MSPKGRPFNQALAAELAGAESITLLCGRYEGFDARLGELFPLEEVSLGDFVLNGGESAALAVCEAASRLLPGFMGHEESGLEESFSASLLEYPHYTRPEVFEGLAVPEILRGGDHAAIARWRRQEALAATARARPELLEQARLSPDEVDCLRDFYRHAHKRAGRNLYLTLLHYPVLDKEQKNVAVSLTNLDIHDISRSSRTYGLGRFFIVTPLEDQRFVLDKVLEHWVDGAGGQSNPDRREALSRVTAVNALADVVAILEKQHGSRPLLWGSSADYSRPGKLLEPRGRKPKRKEDFSGRIICFDEARKILYTRPAVLLLGTGHGLAPEIIEQCDHLLPPLRRFADYNHLSVRSAGTVILDRILGEWG